MLVHEDQNPGWFAHPGAARTAESGVYMPGVRDRILAQAGAISAVATQIMRGDLSQRLPVRKADDEINTLAREINTLRSQDGVHGTPTNGAHKSTCQPIEGLAQSGRWENVRENSQSDGIAANHCPCELPRACYRFRSSIQAARRAWDESKEVRGDERMRWYF